MSGSSLEFYADESDLTNLFCKIDEFFDFEFVQSISDLNKENIRTEDTLILLEYLVSEDMPSQTHSFLCINKGANIVPRTLNMKSVVGQKKLVEQTYNPDSARILLGGQVNKGLIVHSTISTTGVSQTAKSIFKDLKKVVVDNSKKVKSFYVMPSAYEKCSSGVRLAQGVDAPPNYDLKL